MKTLTAERKEKFLEILEKWYQDNPPTREATEFNENVANELVLASFSRSERQAGKDSEEQNVELMRGDWREYPEHLHEVARSLRDVWKFTLPPKPQKGSKKGNYGFYISAMEDIKIACGEFGAKVLEDLHTDWRAGFKNGLAPYTIPHPSSLVNVAAGKAREMRDNLETTKIRKEGQTSGYFA